MITLITGRPDSGKSFIAEDIAMNEEGGAVYYIATMKVMDEAGRLRVEKHREQRKGKGFVTVEAPMDILKVTERMENPKEAVVLLECLANLAGNELYDNKERPWAGDIENTDENVFIKTLTDDIEALSDRVKHLIVVTSEYTTDEESDKMTRLYISLLNGLNRKVATIADSVVSTGDIWLKYERLKDIINSSGSMLVAFSGGVDSVLLLETAHRVLDDNAMAITCDSGLFPGRELEYAKKFCKQRGIRHKIIKNDETEVEGFADNLSNRCYLCKKALFTKFKEEAAALGADVVAEGSNLDDEGDYRPGMQAVRELRISSPLKEAGLTKREIRMISGQLGLETYNKPSFACLASRIPYGEKITREKLSMIGRAEQVLYELGFAQFRVRHHGKLARIELYGRDMSRFIEEDTRNYVNQKLRDIGYEYVTLDIAGYRTGSMNTGIDKRRITLIRHGKTAGNLESRFVGKTDEDILDSECERLKEFSDESVKKVYISPLKRARQTAKILFPNAELIEAEDLRECDFGEYEYMNHEELDGLEPYQKFIDTAGFSPFPGGEGRKEQSERSVRAFKNIMEKEKGRDDDIFIVAHGGTIMAIMEEIAVPHKDFYEWFAGNGEGYVIRHEGEDTYTLCGIYP